MEDIPSKFFIPEHQLLTEEEKKNILETFKETELAKINEASQKRLQEEEQIANRKLQETIISQAIEIVANTKISNDQQQLLIKKALNNLENSNLQT